MKRSKYSSFNELPLMLTVQDVADVLGIGLELLLSPLEVWIARRLSGRL